jgi:TPR repeat protein
MKKYLFCLSLLLSGAVYADELADANALFAKKAYPQALQMYTKLANAGNADAQLKMGEMYLYGEAGTVDMAKAESWFAKSAAKGNKTAVASLEMMKQRVLRKADIDHWVSQYDGSEFKTGKNRCPVPRLPAMSKQNDEIQVVATKVQAWQACFNAFVDNLNASNPLTKKIPKDVADLMTKEEMAAATTRLEGVYSSLVEESRIASKLFLADYAVWRDATDKYVGQHNEMVKANKK